MKEKGHRRGEKKTTYKPDGNFSNLLLSPDKLNYGMGESATRNPLRIYYVYITLEQENIILLYDMLILGFICSLLLKESLLLE